MTRSGKAIDVGKRRVNSNETIFDESRKCVFKCLRKFYLETNGGLKLLRTNIRNAWLTVKAYLDRRKPTVDFKVCLDGREGDGIVSVTLR